VPRFGSYNQAVVCDLSIIFGPKFEIPDAMQNNRTSNMSAQRQAQGQHPCPKKGRPRQIVTLWCRTSRGTKYSEYFLRAKPNKSQSVGNRNHFSAPATAASNGLRRRGLRVISSQFLVRCHY